MDAELVLEAVGEIGEDLVREAERAKPKRNRLLLAAAACAAVLLLAVGGLNRNTAGVEDALPQLEVNWSEGSFGFEGILCYDIGETGDANPWNRSESIESLPVYRNLAYFDAAGAPVYLSGEEMLELAEEAAAALGETVLTSRTRDFDGQIYGLSAQTTGPVVEVEGNGSIRILFSESVALPEGYSLSYQGEKESLEAALALLEEKYADLTEIPDPVAAISIDYTFSGEPNPLFRIYALGETERESILNYNFSDVTFYEDGEGGLRSISIKNGLCAAEWIGEYPLISPEEAIKLLLKGEYLTTVPEEYLQGGIVSAEQIAKTELVYRTGSNEEIFMPYYRFYVEVDIGADNTPEGLKNYGTYYVPAVRGEYLTDFPVWDESFN